MFLPYGTDAPIYHWPRGTVALIAINVGVYAVARSHWEEAQSYMLTYGDGLHPLQWMTYSFIHPGIPTLLINLLFLWMFGMIVEGKLGTLKFLPLYLGLAVVEGLIEQGVVPAPAKGIHGMGTTTLIFSLLAIAVVWAPKNDVSCVWIGFTVKNFDIPIAVLASFYLVSEVIVVALLGMTGRMLSVTLMHLIGAALGFGLATLLLKTDIVDCENWDLFSVLAHKHTRSGKKTAKAKDEWAWDGVEEEKVELDDQTTQPGSLRDEALEKLNAAVKEEHAPAALALYRKIVEKKTLWTIAEADHLALIKLLLRERMSQDLVPLLERYVQKRPDVSDRLRLVLARTLIREQQRPAHGLRIIETIPQDRLPRPMKDLYLQLRGEAHQMREAGVLELEGEGW